MKQSAPPVWFLFCGFWVFWVFFLFPIPNVNFITVALPPTASSLLLHLEASYYNVGFFSVKALRVYCYGTLLHHFLGCVCMSCLNITLQDVGFFFCQASDLCVMSPCALSLGFKQHLHSACTRTAGLVVPYAEITLPSYFLCLTRPVISLSFSTPLSSSLLPLLYWNLTMSYLSIMCSSFFPVTAFL